MMSSEQNLEALGGNGSGCRFRVTPTSPGSLFSFFSTDFLILVQSCARARHLNTLHILGSAPSWSGSDIGNQELWRLDSGEPQLYL